VITFLSTILYEATWGPYQNTTSIMRTKLDLDWRLYLGLFLQIVCGDSKTNV